MYSTLRRSEEKYRTLVESIDEGFCVIEMIYDDQGNPVDYRFLEINPAFEEQTGLRNAEGKLMLELEPKHERHWFNIYGKIALTGESARFVQEARHLGERWFDVYAFRVGEPEERTVGVLFRDISERMRMVAQLRESDRMKDEFLAVLGHELRNPLAPMQTGLELIEHAHANPELLDRIVPMMRRQLSHLVRLVDDLLDMSRVTRGRIALQRDVLELNAPVEAAIEQVRGLIEERNHILRLRFAPSGVFVNGDFERLTQVVANLLTNAAKYSDPGGVITVTTASEHNQAIIRVRDTGLGIPPSALDSLFQLFSQIAAHPNRECGGGLGIGLALSRSLVEMHGGSIEARSEGSGCGSEFVVQLPLPDSQSQVCRAPPSAPVEHTSKRILIVDDNVDAADALHMLLETHGNTVTTAYNGPDALQVVERFQPDLVLLDLGLPGMDGVEVAQRMRSNGVRTRIIAITGWGQDRDRARTKAAGFDDHLTKPVNTRQLFQVLERLMNRGAS